MIKDFKDFVGLNVVVTCKDKDIVKGKWVDWQTEDNLEDDEEAFIVIHNDRGYIAIYESEIKEIKPV